MRAQLGVHRGEALEERPRVVSIELRIRAHERREQADVFARPDRLAQRAHEPLLRREPLAKKPDCARRFYYLRSFYKIYTRLRYRKISTHFGLRFCNLSKFI